MNGVLVQYKVKADRVEENEAKVRAVYRELAERNDPAIHYATFKLEDGQTFAHLAIWAHDAADAGLGKIEAFRAFQENIAGRCEVPPHPASLELIGNWKLLPDGV
ncbi:MAG: hypothetical protein O3A10_09845 [Chloroflexi bacterium]|nr:hypothetical protein [Chloroflexota bacterium]